MPKFDISESGVPIAAEDRYLIFSFGKGHSLCPHTNHAIHLGDMVYRLSQDLRQVIPIFDLRGLE